MDQLSSFRIRILLSCLLIGFGLETRAGCVTTYAITASPPPANGTYSCGQTVTFCVTISGWDIIANNWFQGITASFGPGWDMSTLTHGAPPAAVGGSGGSWVWANSVTPPATAGDNAGTQGPGFFFDLNNDGNPGNNFGDFSTAGPWTFCWTISVLDPPACVDGANLDVTITTFSDSQTGAWIDPGCGNGALPVYPATVGCPFAGNDGNVPVCGSGTPTNLFPSLGASPGGTWTGPGGTAFSGTYDPATNAPGAYTYTLPGACPDDHAVIIVSEVIPLSAGPDGALPLCSNSAPTNLITALSGAAGGGTWTRPNGNPFSGVYDPANNNPGVFTYTAPANAPCPADQATVTVTEIPPVNAGADGTLTTCSTSATTALRPLLAGAPNNGTWTDPGGTTFNGTYDPAVNAPGIYTYTVAGTAPCPNDQATVTVTENAAPNAGTDGTLTICSQGAATGLFLQLSGASGGGTWTGPGGVAHGANYDPLTDAPGVYTYTLAGTPPCPADQAIVTVSETSTPNAGGDGAITLCANGAAASLLAQLTTPDAGGTWTAPGGASHGANIDPTVDPAGIYTYTIAATAPCLGDQAQVNVTINTPPNAGTDGAVSVCDQGAPINMALQLVGETAGGTWTDAGGATHGANYDPAVDVPGVFTYTLNGAAPCAADQATVTVSETSTPNAGGDGAITLCANGASASLLAQLTTPDAGGTWTAPGGASHGANIDPTVDPAGIYTYTIAATAPCLGDQAQVNVTINAPPNAGTDGAVSVCDQGAPINMALQLVGETAGGTWTDAGGATHGANYDPAVDVPGVFTYTVNGAAPCAADQATVTVTETSTPNAGGDGAITLCANGASASLLAQLTTPDAGGTWTAPGGASHGANIDPTVDPAGIYTYTIAATAPCLGDQAQVNVTINTPPNAGTDGAMGVCDQGAATNMFAQLTGAGIGGTWTDASGATHGASYDPAVDAPGVFTYTVNGAAPCAADQATVTVGETSTPNAGGDGAITLCANGASASLLAQLTTPDAGGTWTAPGGASHGANIDPTVDPAGIYTYTIAATAPCLGDQAQVNVTINAPPNAGTDGAMSVCDQGAATNMFAQLTGAGIGGTWTDASGATHGASYDPAVDAPGVFTYTVNGAAPCAADQATVTVGETSTPNAGGDGAITLCANGASASLLAQLTTPDAGGTWTAPGGASHGANIDPTVDPAGIYTYTIAATAPCLGDQAQVNVTINAPPNAGTDGAMSVCDQGAATNMFAQLSGAGIGGTWTTAAGATHGASYDPAVDVPGVFTYTVNGAAPCAADQATVTVSETSTPNAGGDGAITLCANGASASLLAQLTTPDAGGTWTAPGGASHGANIDPTVDPAGIYTYTIAATAPCLGDQAQVNVTINTPPNAGTDGAVSVCDQGGSINMALQLVGETAGGTWTAPSGATHGANYDPTVDAPGAYTYTVAGSVPCAADQATVTVSETSTPNAGGDGAITLCANGASASLLAQLTTPDAGGTWTAPGGASHGANIDPTVDPAGIYTYTIAATAPCLGDQAQVNVTINTPPNAGTDGAVSVCDQGAPINMALQLVGETAGGTWTDAGGATHGANYDPAVDVPGVFTYTLNGAAPCAADQATVTVSETSTPNAGGDGAITLCANGASASLLAQLTTPDAGGTWTAPGGASHGANIDPTVDPAGIYTYTIAATAPCLGDQAQVNVTINTPPNAGTDGAMSVCDQGAATNMFAQLTGAGIGGTWTDAAGATHAANYDPAVDVPGVFTYTVNGAAPCAADQATVTVSETSTPNAGGDGAITLCANGAAANLLAQLVTPDAGGTWTAPGGASHGANIDPTVDPAGIYTYTIAATAPCLGDQAQVNVTINAPPNAGTDGAMSVCDQGAATNMFAQLTGAGIGGTWTTAAGATHGANYDPAVDAPGVFTYTLNGAAPCAADQATVTVGETSTPNAGGDGAITLCANGASASLLAQLTTPDAGGTWTAPGGASHGASIDPTVDAAGIYTYTIAATAPCLGDQAQVNVTINTPPNAGTDGAMSVCDQGAATNMFAQLTGAGIGGTWTDAAGAMHGANYDPAVDVPGVFTYTLNGAAPCAADQATVTVSETSTPNAGGDGAITLCSDGAPTDLSAQLSGADPSGTWSDPSGAVHTAAFDPTIDPAGTYTYTIAPVAPCAGDAALVVVTVNAAPNAGGSALLDWCDQGGPADLFAQLSGPDEGGTWSAPNGTAHGIVFDPTTDASGAYTYTVAGAAPCMNATSTVTVSVVQRPDPGTDGTIARCTNGIAGDLFAALGGTPAISGTWAAPDGSAHTPVIDPATDASGAYTYTVNGQAPCPNSSSHVQVNIAALPDAGGDASVVRCVSAMPVDLFTQLGGTPQANGTWHDPDGTVSMGVLSPATGLSGDHTYTVTGTAPCPDVTATVHVQLVDAANAGSDAGVALCDNDQPHDLFQLLGATPDAGGAWTDPNGNNAPVLLDPAAAMSGTYAYIVSGLAPCPNDTSFITVQIAALPTDGLSATVELCSSDDVFDAFTAFNGAAQTGGTWSDPSGSSVTAQWDPADAASGTYTYTLAGTAPCPTGHNTITLQVDQPLAAGADGTLTLCSNMSSAALFPSLQGSADAGGTWTDPAMAASNGTIDPAMAAEGVYVYSVPAVGVCAGDAASVTVVIHDLPNAGADSSVTWCENMDPSDPVLSLAGSPQPNGAWTTPDGTSFSGALDPGTAVPGAYTYTVAGITPCPSVSAHLVVTIDQLPDPGTAAYASLCPEADDLPLFPLIGTGATTGGTWNAPDGTSMNGILSPGSMTSGTYFYTLEGTGACVGNTFVTPVAVTIWQSPSATFSLDTAIGCIPFTVHFHLQDPSIASSTWHWTDNGSGYGAPDAVHVFGAAGSYGASTTVVDTNGCTAAYAANDIIFVQPTPIALFSSDPDPTSTNDPLVHFTPEHAGYSSYAWSIDGDDAGSGSPWSHTFNNILGGEYDVCLQVTDDIGCTATYCDPVTVRDGLNIHVPNAFTPDGDDLNDEFAPVLVGADPNNYSFYIFDRWGNTVFESHTPGEPWNGGMHNAGTILVQDVYSWRLIVGDLYSADRKEMFGHVTLLK